MKKKIIAAMCIFVLVFCFYSFSISKAETLQEKQEHVKQQKEEAEQKLEYVQGELTARIVKIQELEDSIQTSQKEIEQMEVQLEEIQKKVEETQEKLELVQENYKENEELLEKRLVVLYETGDVTFIDILLHSASIIDFISNYYTIEQVLQNDTELLETIEKERNQIENTKLELDQQKAN